MRNDDPCCALTLDANANTVSKTTWRILGIRAKPPNEQHQRPGPAATEQRAQHGQTGWPRSAGCRGWAPVSLLWNVDPRNAIRVEVNQHIIGVWRKTKLH